MRGNLAIHVLMRASKTTGEVDTAMTALGCEILELWAVQYTTPQHDTIIFNRETGRVVMVVKGGSIAQKIRRTKCDGDLGMCEDYGITLSELDSLKSGCFDKAS